MKKNTLLIKKPSRNLMGVSVLLVMAAAYSLWVVTSSNAKSSLLSDKHQLMQATLPASTDAPQTDPCAQQLTISPFGGGQQNASLSALTANCDPRAQAQKGKETDAAANADIKLDMEMIAKLKPMWSQFQKGERDLAGPILMTQLKCESFAENYEKAYPDGNCSLSKTQLAEAVKYLNKEAESGSDQANAELVVWRLSKEKVTLDQLQEMKNSLVKRLQSDSDDDMRNLALSFVDDELSFRNFIYTNK
jgi:hypothetical protein